LRRCADFASGKRLHPEVRDLIVAIRDCLDAGQAPERVSAAITAILAQDDDASAELRWAARFLRYGGRPLSERPPEPPQSNT
jgi:hypothetical protein